MKLSHETRSLQAAQAILGDWKSRDLSPEIQQKGKISDIDMIYFKS